MAGDLCNYNGVVGCNLPPSTLLSWNAYNAAVYATGKGVAQTLTPGSARFLVNGAYADTVYNSPWGNVGRSTLRDARINRANFEILKDLKVSERLNIQYFTAFQNVFNHPNFSSVDPFLEDAGYTLQTTGFGIPSLYPAADRIIQFGLKIQF
jgi:hypothetical protein